MKESVMDAMCYEVFAEEREALQRYLPKRLKLGFSPNTIQSDRATHPPAGLVAIRTQSRIPPAWAQELSGVLTRSSGFDHLLDFRNRHEGTIACGYLPSYCARAVAEHALLMMLALARKLKAQLRQFDSFDRNGLTGVECANRTLVVVGVGRIGQEIAKLGAGIGMHVKGVDLVKRVRSLEYVTLDEAIRVADVIACALPLTGHTRGMLNYARLRAARRGATLVNIARGEISPIQDLRRLLDDGILSGVGLDVHEDEPALAESLRSSRGASTQRQRTILSLKDADHVLLSPHNAFNTQEALERKAQQSAEAIVRFLTDRSFPHPIPQE